MPPRAAFTDDPAGLLTPRERECLRLVDQHLSSKEIARALGMSKTSVDTYCDRARRKLGVPDRYEAARVARVLDREPVPIASGQDTVRTDAAGAIGLDDPASRETSDGRGTPELRGARRDRAGSAPEAGDREFRSPLADVRPPGRVDPDLHLGSAGTTAYGSRRDAGAGIHGAAPGVGNAEDGAVQARRDGPARSSLHDLGLARRELPSGRRQRTARNHLRRSSAWP
jgi:DNA-binding CsgD family transcriptional regulator